MAKGLLINRRLYFFALIIGTFLSGCQQGDKVEDRKMIGENKDLFIYINQEWGKNEEYRKNHDRMKNAQKNFVLFEYGNVNFKNYFYYYIDIDTMTMGFKNENESRTDQIDKQSIERILSVVCNVKKQNSIYDGTPAIDDGNIYILTLDTEMNYISIGSYGLILGENYQNNDKEIAKENISIIINIMKSFERVRSML